jgi:hypothetical protein
VVVAVVVAAIALIAVAVLLAFPSDDDDAPAAASTTTTESASTTEEAEISASATTTTLAAETTTSGPTTTTTSGQSTENPFVGWWRSTDLERRTVELRVSEEGEIFLWDSASELCVSDGVNSPLIREGFSTFKPFGTPTLAISGPGTCHLYGAGQQPMGDQLIVFSYDAATDMIESQDDDRTRYERSPSVPGIPTDDSNPFIGSWEGTDSDLTHVEMTILADGTWNSTDTRSGGCERNGFTYAAWSADGSGTFDLNASPTFDIALTTYCQPVGEEKLVQSPEANFVLSYKPETDTLSLNGTDIEYTRLP